MEAAGQDVTTTANTPSTSSIIPALPLQNQVPLLMLMSPADALTLDVVEKLFQVYQRLPTHDSWCYKKYLQRQLPIPMDMLDGSPSTTK